MRKILIAYPGPTHSTFDVATGYDKALRSIGHSVVSFQYHNYIRFYSESLSNWRGLGLTTYAGGEQDAYILASERLALHVVDFVPDVVLIISGVELHKRAYDLIARLRVPMILLCTESPYQDAQQIRVATLGHASAILTNERNSAEALASATNLPVRYLPHSYDPERHRPGLVTQGPTSSVFFHGTLWPERAEMLDGLRDIPGAAISGWDMRGVNEQRDGDYIDNEELAALYRSAVICVNHHRQMRLKPGDQITAGDAWSLGPRAYEIAACGGFQVCDNTRGELRAVFGGSVPTYDTAAELRALVVRYLADSDERARLTALQGAAMRGCTFDNRAADIVAPLIEEVCNGR